LLDAGAAEVRLVNRTAERARALAEQLGPKVGVGCWGDARSVETADLLVNATTLGRDRGEPLTVSLGHMKDAAVVMDMIYRPLRTDLLQEAEARGLSTVDGLAMLIGQARPSFEALFGRPPPHMNVRKAALEAMG
jgi:shikimate dehydrogenase